MASSVYSVNLPCDAYLPLSLFEAKRKQEKGLILQEKEIKLKEIKHGLNASLIKIQEGLYYLFFRFDTLIYPEKKDLFHTHIGFAQLDSNFNQISPVKNISRHIANTVEDPRAFLVDKDIYVVYNYAAKEPNHRKIQIGKFNEKLSRLEVTIDFKFPMNPIEKNWSPFGISSSPESLIGLIYKTDPQQIFTYDLKKKQILLYGSYFNNNSVYPLWKKKFGELRGGTPAISLSKTEYITFFHSSFYDPVTHFFWYVMGAYTFSKNPPFFINKISQEAIVYPSMYKSPHKHTAPLDKMVCFPCGVVMEKYKGKEVFHVSIGENDCHIKIITIDKEKLLRSLKKFP